MMAGLTENDFKRMLDYIRGIFYTPDGTIALHEPRFVGNEKKYLLDAVDSTYVSSVGPYVNKFEDMIRETTGASYAIAVVNGTCALHMALLLAGVAPGEEVITQPLTFVATANAIVHANALPHFVDVDNDTMGMSPGKLKEHLSEIALLKDGKCYNKITGNRIAACVPMHTFGMPLRIDEVVAICNDYNIPVVEDSTESAGSFYKNRHTGVFGLLGTFSFNGNKTITSGAGGAIITNDEIIGKKARHLSTTAKIPHAWEFVHDAVGYNYRMPNLNAALACAQLEQLDKYVANKRSLFEKYRHYLGGMGIHVVTEIDEAKANYWLCTILLNNREERDAFLKYSNEHKVMCRPAWRLMTKLNMYKNCFSGDLGNALWLEDRIVNIPSSVRLPL